MDLETLTLLFPKHLDWIQHKTNDRVYGALVEILGVKYFKQHKAVEVNKGKSLPKVSAEIQFKFKEVDDSIYNSFNSVKNTQIFYEETYDLMQLDKVN